MVPDSLGLFLLSQVDYVSANHPGGYLDHWNGHSSRDTATGILANHQPEQIEALSDTRFFRYVPLVVVHPAAFTVVHKSDRLLNQTTSRYLGDHNPANSGHE